MARIRTVKPEFWDSPGIETLEFQWRLLYVAMWNWADDTGTGKAEARELMGFAFPRDEDMTLGEFRRGLGEVRRVFGVTFYKVEGRAYYSIPAWDRHQKIDKRSGSRWPSQNMGEQYDPITNSAPTKGSNPESNEPADDTPNTRWMPGAGTGEQRNRATEEQGNAVVTLSDADAPDGENDEPDFCEEELPTEDIEPTPGYPTDFTAFWDAYPRRGGKGAACASFVKAKKRASVETIVAGALRLKNDPNLPSDKSLVPLPATWLNQSRWDDDPLPERGSNTKQTPMDRVAHTAQLGHQLQAQYDQKQIGTNS